MSSLSEELAVFSLAGPKAAETLALADCPSCPAPGRAVEWEFEGEKVKHIHIQARTCRHAQTTEA